MFKLMEQHEQETAGYLRGHLLKYFLYFAGVLCKKSFSLPYAEQSQSSFAFSFRYCLSIGQVNEVKELCGIGSIAQYVGEFVL